MELYYVIKDAMFGDFTEDERNRVVRQAKIFATLRHQPNATVIADLHRENVGSLSYSFRFLEMAGPVEGSNTTP
jgi:hypothetical protein